MKEKPTRIQLRRAKGWRKPPNTVVVSRPGPWGNPFIVGKHGDAERCVYLFRKLCEGYLCIGMKEDCICDQFNFMRHAKAHITELRGKNLACWCRKGKPCHADVLLEIANKET